MRAAFVALALLGACVSPGHVQCDDGRTCPSGTTCDDERDLCLVPAQLTACNGLNEGDVCTTTDGVSGICDRTFCEPGCGDGTTDPVEQCDDGNFASHDGCSSRCEVEIPTWVRIVPPWNGITQHVIGYHAGLARTVMLTGTTRAGLSDRIWQRDPQAADDRERGWHDVTDAFAASERPAPRINAVMAYDPARGLVLYGGIASLNANLTSSYMTDTWEYAASSDSFENDPVGRWRRVPTTTTPGAVFNPMMAYDANVGSIVLIGGIAPGAISASQRMWKLVGDDWVEMTVSGSIPARQGGGLAFDVARDRLVLVGGSGANDTIYEFQNNTWALIAPSGGPGPRRLPAVAYDAVRGSVVLFGGTTGSSETTGDTWAWDGTWTQLTSTNTPGGRRHGKMTAEPDGLLLVGGATLEGEPYRDAWTFAADFWTERTPRFDPGTTAASASIYSPAAHGVLVTGGIASSFAILGESWFFDGLRWRRRPDLPTGRAGANLVYDAENDRFLVFGGGDYTVADTTAWWLPGNADATASWTQLPSTWSGARHDAGSVYDATGHRSIVFGGLAAIDRTPGTWVFDGSAWSMLTGAEPALTIRPPMGYHPETGLVFMLDRLGDTWQLAGATWTKVIPAAASKTPPPRESSGMTWDRFRKRFVLASGTEPDLGPALDDVWELDPVTLTWQQLFVSGESPLPRSDTLVFALHEDIRALVIHGGRDGGNLNQGDTWLMKFLSSTPDENCKKPSEDADGDQQVASNDPDCDPPPP